MDQRPEDQERGAGIGTDNISGRLLKAEWQQMARWRHWSMTSRNMDLDTVETQMATWYQAADMYAKLGTKGATCRGSGSEGWCGKKGSEQIGECMQRIGVAQVVD